MMVLEMRSVSIRQTDGSLLCEEVLGLCVDNKVKCPSVKSGTGFFYDTLNSLTFTFKILSHSPIWPELCYKNIYKKKNYKQK